MGRKRKLNKHLPRRVYYQHGAYYLVDKENKWHRLGKSLGEAYSELAQIEGPADISTFDELCDRYVREVLFSYTLKEQKNRAAHIKRIRAVFGEMRAGEITGGHVRAFRDKIGQRRGRYWDKPQMAIKALSVLSHMFTWAAEWDIVRANPCIGVRRPEREKRMRYPTDAEFQAVYEQCSPMLQVAMDLALLTGLRRGDMLSLDRDAITAEGLMVQTSKTGQDLLFTWSAELRAVTKRALAIPPRVRRHVICNRQGEPYTADGFSAVWRSARQKAIESGKLKQPFRFNDIRAKSASDDGDLDRASMRLGHTSRQTTERHYLRTAKRVQPLR